MTIEKNAKKKIGHVHRFKTCECHVINILDIFLDPEYDHFNFN